MCNCQELLEEAIDDISAQFEHILTDVENVLATHHRSLYDFLLEKQLQCEHDELH